MVQLKCRKHIVKSQIETASLLARPHFKPLIYAFIFIISPASKLKFELCKRARMPRLFPEKPTTWSTDLPQSIELSNYNQAHIPLREYNHKSTTAQNIPYLFLFSVFRGNSPRLFHDAYFTCRARIRW